MSASAAPPPAGSQRRRTLLLLVLLALLLVFGAVPLVRLVSAHLARRLQKALVPEARQRSLTQARRIYNACQAYFSTRGRYPSTLEDLVPDFLNDQRALADPGYPAEGEPGYYYYLYEPPEIPAPEAPLLASKGGAPHEHALIRFDGKASFGPLPPRGK